MFEVGKKYKGKWSGFTYVCLAVVGENVLLQIVDRRTCQGVMQCQFRDWELLPPEPKRWSNWQNVYVGPKEDGVGGFWGSKIEANTYKGEAEFGQRLGILRRDFEQHEGKPATCVKVELEKC